MSGYDEQMEAFWVEIPSGKLWLLDEDSADRLEQALASAQQAQRDARPKVATVCALRRCSHWTQ